MKRILLLLITIFLYSSAVWSQNANDCVNAIVICGNNNIASNSSGVGIRELEDLGDSCFVFESNSLWLQLTIAESGTFSFVLTPDNTDISVDYDFYLFGPDQTCGNFNDPIRCSTTNPSNAGLSNNLTGLRDQENDTSEGPGADGNSFVSSVDVFQGETYFLLLTRPIGNGGFNLAFTGTADFFNPPQIDNNRPDDILLCTIDATTTVDLTIKGSEITVDPDATVSYYESLENAIDGLNAIPNPELYGVTANLVPIFARVEGRNGCFEVIDFDIQTALFLDGPANLAATSCNLGPSPIGTFNLGTVETAILDRLANASNFSISFHNNEAEATNNLNAIPDVIFQTALNQIYARISLNADPSCFETEPIALQIVTLPSITTLVQCDVETSNSTDGITSFNLEEAFRTLPDADLFDFSFFASLQDRDTNTPITNLIGYRNQTPFSQTIFYSAINSSLNCETFGSLELQVQPTTVSLNPQSPFFSCDENAFDAIQESTFDLEMIRNINYPNLEVNFYNTLDDLTLELNPLTGNFTTTDTTLFVRIENSNQCQGVEEIELRVSPAPVFALEDTYLLCTDNPPLLLNSPSGFDQYTWVLEGSPDQIISSQQLVSITEIGNYRLEVGSQQPINAGGLLCTSSVNFEVLPSNIAIIQNVIIEDISSNNTIQIEVTGDGDYEYSIDGISFQDSPLFENLNGGFFTVFVRDKNGCGIQTEDVAIIDYPRFFTPNGDGVNDVWSLQGANALFQPQTSIAIFNRFGQLLSVFSPTDIGWDGNFNNRPLPASDYWFKVLLEDGREFNGHFALKR